VHLALFKSHADHSCQHRPQVYFGGGLRPSEERIDVIDSSGVGNLRKRL
jgi:hypothetical protein